jgi:ElaB/YqjD/DUF883 family membrane-anchored ribosome-binding protein
MSARETNNGHAPMSEHDLREEIDRTRDELAETVDSLAARADVKARVHHKADEAKHQVRQRAAEAKDEIVLQAGAARSVVAEQPVRAALVAGVALLAGAAAIVVWRRSR